MKSVHRYINIIIDSAVTFKQHMLVFHISRQITSRTLLCSRYQLILECKQAKPWIEILIIRILFRDQCSAAELVVP